MSHEKRRTDVPKLRLTFDRATTPDDTRLAKRDVAAIIKGKHVETTSTLSEIVAAMYLDDSDRREDGGYAFKKGTVDLKFVPDADGKCWRLNIIAVRGVAPVVTGLVYDTPQGADGSFTIISGFSKHHNQQLDSQHIDNPDMHNFVLDATMKEVRQVKEPMWWHAKLAAYDKVKGTNKAEEFLARLNASDASAAEPASLHI